MTNKGILAIFAVIFVLCSSASLLAQQDGSVAIAESIRQANDPTLSEFTKCVIDLKNAGMKIDSASKACTKVTSIKANTSTRIANEAADATKASRPMVVVDDSYGYGGYGSRRTVVVQPVYQTPTTSRTPMYHVPTCHKPNDPACKDNPKPSN